MAERDSWAVMDGSTRKVDAEDARLAITALMTTGATSVRGRQGLRPGPGNPGLVTASGTPDINVNVEKFQAIVTATRGLGEYIATLDADKTINVLGDNPAHGTQQRNHLIIALQTDTYYSDGTSKFEVIEVIGVAGAGDPSLAAYSDYILLARLRITAGASTVTSAMIDDLRPSWFVALGGLLPVKDNVERDALTAWDGLHIYRRDRDWHEIRDGGAWRVQGVAVCSSTADRDSAITSPYNGQLAYTSNTGKMWQRHSGAWREFPAQPSAQMRQTSAQSLSHATFTAITFTTEDYDSHGGHDNATNPSRYTAPIDGQYELSGGVGFTANASGFRALVWSKNGTRIAGSQTSAAAIGGGASQPMAARTIKVQLVAGDYVELVAYQDSGGGALNTSVSNDEQSSMTVTYTGS